MIDKTNKPKHQSAHDELAAELRDKLKSDHYDIECIKRQETINTGVDDSGFVKKKPTGNLEYTFKLTLK